MMETETEMLNCNAILTWLTAQEDFTVFSHYETFNAYPVLSISSFKMATEA
jgi:hypothetical protein